MLPALFVSHGAPTFPLTDNPAKRFLSSLGEQLAPRPRSILVVSAHWETAVPTVNAVQVNETIHDFYGFPEALYQLRYPAPGSAALADRVAKLLTDAGFGADRDSSRGLDHGAWVPLSLIYPKADIPVVQLSIQPQHGPDHHFELGKALAPLRREGVLVMGSGSFTHDLGSFRAYAGAPGAAEPDWVSQFADWMSSALDQGRIDDVLHYRDRAPFAARNHPTEDHILPLFVAMGAGGAPVSHLHASTTYAILRMDVFAFGGELARG